MRKACITGLGKDSSGVTMGFPSNNEERKEEMSKGTA